MSLTLIACDRFFGIVFAMKAHIIERRACHSIIMIWMISLAMGAPMLVVRTVHRRQWLNHLELWCDGDWPSVVKDVTDSGHVIQYRPGRMAYLTVITVVLFFLPMLVMFVTYGGIIKTLWDAKVPGERLSSDVKVEIKVKRRVSIL